MASFLGSWLVSEYVYNPNGSFAGINRQHRLLEKLKNGHIRVTQNCDPAPELSDHPLGRFRGEWIFDLSVDGRARRYHGPDVLGTGLTWGEGVMTGRGLWPNLQFNFTSFGILPTPKRQLTGGKFMSAGQMQANIVGIAVNEASSDEYPVFDNLRPDEISQKWAGTRRVFLADGSLETESAVDRRYQDKTWREADIVWDVEEGSDSGIRKVNFGQAVGLSKKYGNLLEAELVVGTEVILEVMEVFDPVEKHLVGMRKWHKDHVLEKVDVFFLKPE
ncbi:MAG: hypothetical protein GY755_02330 [Chloroflexi bacterium]|nr:hypothetical protein [Chloroflexota bacterium]